MLIAVREKTIPSIAGSITAPVQHIKSGKPQIKMKKFFGGIDNSEIICYKYNITLLRCGGDRLKEDRETKERLLESARSEFAEKGYTKASLRKICANAGVTTGALYFFFKDKEDLFAAIVEPPLAGLKGIMLSHFAAEGEAMSQPTVYEHIDGDHNELSAALIHHIYLNHDAFMLLLTKSQGSRFESAVDEIVEMTERTYLAVAEKMKELLPNKRVNTYMMHWLAHMIIDAFIHLFTHELNEDKALGIMNRIMDFLIGSWIKLVLDDE